LSEIVDNGTKLGSGGYPDADGGEHHESERAERAEGSRRGDEHNDQKHDDGDDDRSGTIEKNPITESE
jgi:hypothetical protein